jgi:hypothetical protein
MTTGRLAPSIDALAMPLEGPAYMLSDEHKALGRALLKQGAVATYAGLLLTHAGRAAVESLRKIAPQLLLERYQT